MNGQPVNADLGRNAFSLLYTVLVFGYHNSSHRPHWGNALHVTAVYCLSINSATHLEALIRKIDLFFFSFSESEIHESGSVNRRLTSCDVNAFYVAEYAKS